MQNDQQLRKPSFKKRTILLVDDEQLVVDAGKHVLERLGYTVYTAINGLDAIDVVKKMKVKLDLVILDMNMPDVSGREVFDTIKTLDQRIKVPLSSGESANGDASRMLENGCNGFIQKPFSILELSEKIKKIMG